MRETRVGSVTTTDDRLVEGGREGEGKDGGARGARAVGAREGRQGGQRARSEEAISR